MRDSHIAEMSRTCPTFDWPINRWLTAPLADVAADVAEELRASLFSRLMPVVLSAFVVFTAALAIALHQRTWPMLLWAGLDGCLLVARLMLFARLFHYRRTHPAEAAPPLFADLHIATGNGWIALLGWGAGACVASGEFAVGIVGSLLTMGVLGAQCGRAFATPRVVALHCLLLIGPYVTGSVLCADPLIGWVSMLAPAYVVSMIGINRQLHRDYVEMISGRLESRTLALRCPLTNLANRRMFDRGLADVMAPGAAEPVCVFCLDLDGFKAVNDSLGHPMGDLLLRHVALRLLRQVPEEALVARLGGDEFAVVAVGLTPTQAEATASGIVAAIRAPFTLATDAVAQIGVSVGMAMARPGAVAPSVLLAEGDQALYAAKRAGKNTFRWIDTMEVTRAA